MKKTFLKLSLLTLTTIAGINTHSYAQGWQGQAANRLIAINALSNNTGQLSPIHVGIGTDVPDLTLNAEVFNTNPDSHLGIAGLSPSIRFMDLVNWTGSSWQSNIGLAGNTGAFVTKSVTGDFIIQNRKNRSLIFGAGGGSGRERMRVDGSGQVGINTEVHPLGNVLDRFDVNLNAGEFVRIENMPTGNYAPVAIDPVTGRLYRGSGTTGGAPNAWLLTGNTGVTAANFLGSINNAALKFRTNNVQRMVIDPTGDVGINIAPNNQYRLQVFNATGDRHIGICGAAPSIRFSNVANWGTAADKADLGLATNIDDYVFGSVPGDFIIQNRMDRALIFGTGLAGNGSERVRIDAAGFMGVNTNIHPAAAVLDRFDVNLNAREFIRFENMPSGEFNILTIDPTTGRLYMSRKTSRSNLDDSIGSEVRGKEQKEMNELKAEIAILKAKVEELSAKRASGGDAFITAGQVTKCTLEQNAPNPFSKETTISFFIDGMQKDANIMITDMNGKQISLYPVKEAGKGSIIVNADNLSAGMYLYTLVVDGVIIDTKRMAIN